MVADAGEVRRLCTSQPCEAASVTMVVAAAATATGKTTAWVRRWARGIVRHDESKERKGDHGGRKKRRNDDVKIVSRCGGDARRGTRSNR
jgi:hypothetical protein